MPSRSWAITHAITAAAAVLAIWTVSVHSTGSRSRSPIEVIQ